MTYLAQLLDIMARLRDPNEGCPWDLEQNFATIAPHTIEEAYEVAEAAEAGDINALKGELGDLLLQVVFHARIAEEAGHFTFEEVARVIGEKLVRRHPHLFGHRSIQSAKEQTAVWENIKAQERAEHSADQSALADVPTALPATTRALKLQKRAARIGFDWPAIQPVYAKLREELAELEQAQQSDESPARLEEELGDLLFAGINLARHLDVDAETALRKANRKFERRFRSVEKTFADSGQRVEHATLEEMETVWSEIKRKEKTHGG